MIKRLIIYCFPAMSGKSTAEFSAIHSEETNELFHELLEAGTIVATKDGFVWVNCV